MRIAFIGAVEFSEFALRRVLDLADAEVVAIVTRESSPFNADFRSLGPLAHEYGVPCMIARGNDQAEMADFLRSHAPDVIYCFGWSYLLRSEILSIGKHGVVGYHPAALPENRGRHPIIWALALGLERTASTFFFMDEGADSGDLLHQEPVVIRQHDTARTLYDRLKEVAGSQIATFTAQLAADDYPRVPQDHGRANYWRKRSREDGRIDWRMSDRGVHNLVRALTRPYPGAHFEMDNDDVRVWRASVVDSPLALPNFEPGKVVAVEADSFVVKCGDGAVRVEEWEPRVLIEPGSYLP